MSQMKVPRGSMVSRYGTSTCHYCYDRMNVGDIIRSGDKGWGHHLCVVRSEREIKKTQRINDNADQANSRRWTTHLAGGGA